MTASMLRKKKVFYTVMKHILGALAFGMFSAIGARIVTPTAVCLFIDLIFIYWQVDKISKGLMIKD